MTTQDYQSKPTLFVDTEDSRRSGFVDMLLNIYADTIPSSEIEDSSAGSISVDSGKYLRQQICE
jgi:ATP-dependent RNA helicase DHX29